MARRIKHISCWWKKVAAIFHRCLIFFSYLKNTCTCVAVIVVVVVCELPTDKLESQRVHETQLTALKGELLQSEHARTALYACASVFVRGDSEYSPGIPA